MYGKLTIITLQEKFLRMNQEQLSTLLGEHLEIRALSLNGLTENPPQSDETILYFISGQGDMKSRPPKTPADISSLCREIEQHGFLTETIAILQTYLRGKKNNVAYGRTLLQRLLAEQGIILSAQQLRLRLEKLNEMGLLIIRPGRGGTTISENGQQLLEAAGNSLNKENHNGVFL